MTPKQRNPNLKTVYIVTVRDGVGKEQIREIHQKTSAIQFVSHEVSKGNKVTIEITPKPVPKYI